MAALLVRYTERTLGEELPLPAERPFTDTQDGYIEKAYAAGIVQGAGEGIFNPDKVVTREQLATMLYRTMVLVDPGGGRRGRSPPDMRTLPPSPAGRGRRSPPCWPGE